MLEIKNLMVFYENAIAINNINMKCQRGKVTGVFGANSAGKSTLMYTISGIILDVKKKEEMKGGERITVLGHIAFEGTDITSMKPSERARKGIVLCPERRRIFAESSTLENLKIGGYLATKSSGQKNLGIYFYHFPALRKSEEERGRFPQRWGTTDAGHRKGLDGPAEVASPRRAVTRTESNDGGHACQIRPRY